MAFETHVTAADHMFLGEDKTLSLPIFTTHVQDVALDVAGRPLLWVLRKTDKSTVALIEKSTETSPPGITVTGVFDPDPSVSTQVVNIHLYDHDSWNPDVSPAIALKKGKYRHSLKDMTPDEETVLAFGNFQFLQSTTR